MEIEIKKETAEFIQALVAEMESQDNLMTQRPNIFTVVDKEEIATTTEYGDRVAWMDADGDECDFEGREYESESHRADMLQEWREKNTGDRRMWFSNSDILEDLGIKEYGMKLIDKPTGAFLTQKAAQAWKRANLHNLHKKAHTWCDTLYYNPEMMRVVAALKEIAEQVNGDQNAK